MAKQATSFSDWLAEFGRGALDNELTAALMEVAESVRIQGKPGALALKLKFSQKGEGVIVEADVSSTVPHDKPSGFFYIDSLSRSLTTRDPRQPELPGMNGSNTESTKETEPNV